MKRIIMFVLLFAALKVAGQTTGYLRFDTVKIMRQNGTAELYIINKTKDTLGLLTNIGGGLTSFKKSKALNDSQIVVGGDTLKINGSGKNISNSSLVANGNYTQNWANNNLRFNSIKGLFFNTSVGTLSGTPKSSIIYSDPSDSDDIPFMIMLKTFKNGQPSSDSLRNFIRETSGQLELRATNFINSKQSGLILSQGSANLTVFTTGLTQTKYISIDTTNIHMAGATPSSTADSVLAQKAGSDIVYKVPYGGGSTSGLDTVFAPLNVADTTKKYAPLVIFAGESNAVSVIPNTGLSPAEKAPNPKIQILNNVNKRLEPLEIGVNNNLNVNFPNAHGWELQLAKSMAVDSAFLGDTVFLVKIARSGASISQLTDSLPVAISRIDTTIKQMRARGFYPQVYVWYSQGINDSGLDTTTWRDMTINYFNELRKYIGYAPIFITKIMSSNAGVNRNNTIAKMPYFDGFTYMVNTDGLSTMDVNHWDSAGAAAICKMMISYSVDTIKQRNLYTQTQVNNIKKGYAQFSAVRIDSNATVANIRIGGNLQNHFVGNSSGNNAITTILTGNFNTSLGYHSLRDVTTGNNNTAVGYNSLRSNTTGSNATAMGFGALQSQISASQNSAFGFQSQGNTTTGFANTSIGNETMQSNTVGSGNTAVGSNALQNSTNDNNTAVGYQAAMNTATGLFNVAIGSLALKSATAAHNNVAIGYLSAENYGNYVQTISIGTSANRNSGGNDNVVVGHEANGTNTGDNNTVIGSGAGFHTTPTSRTGVVYLGYNVGQNATASNRFMVDNSSTANPLLHGDFASDSLMINGKLKVRDMDSSASPANMVWRDPTTKELKLAAVPSATTLYGGDGTLAGNRTVSGGSNSLQLGAFGSQLSSLSIWSAGRINLNGQPAYSTSDHSTDANLTVPANVGFVELHDNLTTDRTVTLPSASAQGQTITFVVRASAGSNHFNLAAGVPDNKTGTTFTQLDWGTTYVFYVNASVAWSLINKY